MPTHNIFNLVKTKDKKEILKAAEKNYTKYRGSKIRMTADFSAETKQARRKMEYSIYKVPKRRRVTMRILYSAKYL